MLPLYDWRDLQAPQFVRSCARFCFELSAGAPVSTIVIYASQNPDGTELFPYTGYFAPAAGTYTVNILAYAENLGVSWGHNYTISVAQAANAKLRLFRFVSNFFSYICLANPPVASATFALTWRQCINPFGP